jgi:hypothetical protein
MYTLSPADELADIRAEMARLKMREAALRALIIAIPPQPGRWHRVEVKEMRARVFDASLLPPQIRENPAYWRERVSQVVRCLPVILNPVPRAGWPIQRDGTAIH